MITYFNIKNYKSIQELGMPLGKVTVLIGENGSGKSNILESVALASAASDRKLDNEFLASRGIRVSESPEFMRSAFAKKDLTGSIQISAIEDGNQLRWELFNDNQYYSKWYTTPHYQETQLIESLKEIVEKMGSSAISEPSLKDKLETLISGQSLQESANEIQENKISRIRDFLIYSPENSALRKFSDEGQIEPLGINGEGLFKLLRITEAEDSERFIDIKEKLELLDWFQNIEIPKYRSRGEFYIKITDRYLSVNSRLFTQKSANEGFLLLLFYFTLFISDKTPRFFAIDNIDASLNPKLCARLIKELILAAKKYDKQVIFTTHNPAILDGLNLDDEDQLLYVVSRNQLGHTRIHRVRKPATPEGREPVKLSEVFLRGYIGGLPKNF